MRKQNLNFRHEEVTYIMDRWKAMEPVSLVGVGSIGKSNLLHHLTDAEVRQKHLGQSAQQYQIIVIDPHLLGPLPTVGDHKDQFRCWAGLELIMHRLYMTLYPFDSLSQEDVERFYELYQALQNGNNPLFAYMGLRYLELALKILFDHNVNIIIMFDEFDELLRVLPPKFFQILRGIRDNYKTHLTYLTFTRRTLDILVSQMEIDYFAIEPFIELFNDNVYYVGPYNEQDALFMLNTLVKRNPKISYPDHIYDFLMASSGRFAGIMRASFRLLGHLGTIASNDIHNEEITKKLSKMTPIIAECKTIWMSLSSIEQQVLKAVARLTDYDNSLAYDEAIKMLLQKQLLKINRDSETLMIEPPLFYHYVQSDPEVSQ